MRCSADAAAAAGGAVATAPRRWLRPRLLMSEAVAVAAFAKADVSLALPRLRLAMTVAHV